MEPKLIESVLQDRPRASSGCLALMNDGSCCRPEHTASLGGGQEAEEPARGLPTPRSPRAGRPLSLHCALHQLINLSLFLSGFPHSLGCLPPPNASFNPIQIQPALIELWHHVKFWG